MLTFLRRLVSVVLLTGALFCALMLASPGPAAPLDIVIAADAIVGATGILLVYGAWRFSGFARKRQHGGMGVDGDASERLFRPDWFMLATATIVLCMSALLSLLTGHLVIESVITLLIGGENWLVRVAFSGLLFAVSAFCALASAKVLFRWRTPLAIIRTDGIALPRQRPDWLNWSDVQAIDILRIGRTSLVAITLFDPVKVLGARRGWWHGPWRDGIYINAAFRTPQIVRAAREALQRHREGLESPAAGSV